jgi:hypothetical protein
MECSSQLSFANTYNMALSLAFTRQRNNLPKKNHFKWLGVLSVKISDQLKVNGMTNQSYVQEFWLFVRAALMKYASEMPRLRSSGTRLILAVLKVCYFPASVATLVCDSLAP